MARQGTCSVCHKAALYDGDESGVCERCRKAFGLPAERPGSRREPRPCSRCGHRVLVRALVRERGASGGEHATEYLAPLAVTFRRVVHVSLLTGRAVARNKPSLHETEGMFEVYVCRACGFTEWYALEPERIPIGPEYGTELVEVDGVGPYR